ncbi:GNAT family N-acetyltransferase [Nocardia sp. NBC_01377]|uniref:GNAT family N-acetyltransferase n=1 Tax=Nocardia sp. NBC_01377 TaxID=2903595 RepID=UPI00324DA703
MTTIDSIDADKAVVVHLLDVEHTDAILDLDDRIPSVAGVFCSATQDGKELKTVAAAVGRGDPSCGAVGAFIGDRLVGVASFFPGRATSTAEVALVTMQAHQDRVAAELMARLTRLARERGMQRFVLDVAPTNSAMMRWFIETGYPVVAHKHNDMARVGVQL